MLDNLLEEVSVCYRHVQNVTKNIGATMRYYGKLRRKKGRCVGCLEHDPSPAPLESCMIQITAQVGDHLRWEEDGAHGGYEEDLGLHQEEQPQSGSSPPS